MPVLEPPPPPPRMVDPDASEPVPTVEPGPADAALLTPPARPPARAARGASRAPEVRAGPVGARAAGTVPAPPALTLKPAPGVAAKTEACLDSRSSLARARRDLQQVNYAALGADGRGAVQTRPGGSWTRPRRR